MLNLYIAAMVQLLIIVTSIKKGSTVILHTLGLVHKTCTVRSDLVLNPNRGHPVFLPVSAWVSAEHSSFIPRYKDMQEANWSLQTVHVSEWCVSPAMDWRSVQVYSRLLPTACWDRLPSPHSPMTLTGNKWFRKWMDGIYSLKTCRQKLMFLLGFTISAKWF